MAENRITPELLAKYGMSRCPPDDPIYSEGPLLISGDRPKDAESSVATDQPADAEPPR